MSKREPHLYLQDILNSINKIKQYTDNVSFKEFEQNWEKIDAVVRNLEIIGEAARNLPEEIADKYPEIPWGEMISMRNKVIHEYFGVDEEILWKTLTEDLPALKKQLEDLPRSLLGH